jgi:hydroxymethylglutaryl-CoA reductase
MSARCNASNDGIALRIPDWGIVQYFSARDRKVTGAGAILRQLLDALVPDADGLEIEVRSRLPLAMGLGSSAALAVVLARALNDHFELSLGDDDVNTLAFACEQTSHGNPSGVDNAIAVYGEPIVFRRGDDVTITRIDLPSRLPLVIAFGESRGVTKQQVADVRARYESTPAIYDGLFAQIDALCLRAVDALQGDELVKLGSYMNTCHGLLNAIGVSTPELEAMVAIARASGATGAKLTGAGGGGSIVALCPGCEAGVADALKSAGFHTLTPD